MFPSPIAIANSPVLSIDETRLFVSSATNSFGSIDSKTGDVVWEVDSGSEYDCEAKVSPDDFLVYAIQVRSNER